MVDHRSQGHPASRHEHQARRNDQGPKPSDFIKASGHQRRAEKAGHMTAADQAGPNVKKALPTGPSTYDGFEKMESGLNARAVDFAKFGMLYLHGGVWRGREIVPPAWVQASTRHNPSVAGPSTSPPGEEWARA